MTPANISVRTAAESDANRLAAIHIAAWRTAYRGVMSDEYLEGMDISQNTDGWRRNILHPKTGTVHLVVQADDDEVVGFAIVGPGVDSPAPASGQLYAINVHPDWWAKGIGTVLFAAAEQTLISRGYQRGFLWVEATNARAISFYTKREWLDDGGTMQDGRFDPPVSERRHSRELSQAPNAVHL